jgi:hypothetical protein
MYDRPLTLPSECRALGEGAISTYFNVLVLTQPARAGLELTTFRLLSESTTTRPLQPVVKKVKSHFWQWDVESRNLFIVFSFPLAAIM